jgi:hypothetical protein
LSSLKTHALGHGGILIAATVLSLLVASGGAGSGTFTYAMALVGAAIAGIAFSTLIHEWFHLGGAKVAGACYTIPKKVGLFVFEYDFENNSLPQFNIMSWAGQIGSWLTVGALALLLDTSNPVLAMIVSGALASAAFGTAIEWPVLQRSQTSGDPLAELSKIDRTILLRSFAIGLSSGYICWLMLR